MRSGAGRVVGLVAMICCWMAAVGWSQPADVVRVGVVVFESGSGDASPDVMWQELFSKWQERSGLAFVYAKGTHSDVLHWMRNRIVDAAVLPAGGLVQERKAEREADQGEDSGASWSISNPHFEYVATLGYPAATTEFAEDDRRRPGFQFFSRPVCVVPKGSELDTQEELLQATRQGKLQFLMVHPYSASGSMLPRAFLLENLAARVSAEQVEYTFSHTESLRRLVGGGSGLAAFVWDGAFDAAPGIADHLKKIDLEGLGEKKIPNETLLVLSGSPHAETLRSLATADGGTERLSFRTFDDWQSRYGQVAEWTRQVRIPEVGFETRRLSLDEVGWLVLYSARTGPPLPRVAVVLSGGGAKCSYQVGVVEALEEKFSAMRESIPHLTDEQRASLDIQLVVGTSGGALNALPVAMGVSTTDEGRRAFKHAWMQSDQREILRPPTTQRVLLGLWFGLLQIGALAWLLRALVRDEAKRSLILSVALLLLGALQLVVWEVSWSPWKLLGTNHLWHHLFLLFTFAVRASAWVLLVAGGSGLLLHRLSVRRGWTAGRAYRVLSRILVALLVVLPVIGLVHVLFYQKTLSDGHGVENQLIATYSKLIEHRPAFSMADRRDTLHRLSEAAEASLQRDLVITGTCLPRTGERRDEDLPDDLYFYARPATEQRGEAMSPFGVRGVSLNDPRYRPLLLDVIMGSGSIFPVFPARVLRDFPVEGESVELVDGGFAHNSPIEAAVMWGATHVIVIESSPEGRSSRKNFVGNVAAAVGHLQQQTAQVDRRSKQHVRVFTLEPHPPHLCILCFADNLIERSICDGYFEATGTRHPGCPEPEKGAGYRTAAGHWFEEDLGPPTFIEVGPPM